jgi:transposase
MCQSSGSSAKVGGSGLCACSQSALGAYFRRLCSRMDKPKAVTAAAHKLARLIHTMLTKGEEYTDQGQAYYAERYRERALRQLTQRANKLGMRLVVDPQAA